MFGQGALAHDGGGQRKLMEYRLCLPPCATSRPALSHPANRDTVEMAMHGGSSNQETQTIVHPAVMLAALHQWNGLEFSLQEERMPESTEDKWKVLAKIATPFKASDEKEPAPPGWNPKPVYEGTREQCLKWIRDHSEGDNG